MDPYKFWASAAGHVDHTRNWSQLLGVCLTKLLKLKWDYFTDVFLVRKHTNKGDYFLLNKLRIGL